MGCGGDGSGESHDFDPGEATSTDIVKWILGSLNGFTLRAGDARALVMWDAGAQQGAAFTYEIHAAVLSTGPFVLVGTTQNSFFVDSGLSNGIPRFYQVVLDAWGTHSAWTETIEVTPQAPSVVSGYPMDLVQTGVAAGLVQADYTHFKTTSTVTCAASGVNIPAASIDVISPTLILFDVETNAAALGIVTLSIGTPDVWAEYGVSGYSETVGIQAEVKPAPSPNYPNLEFVETGGAVAEGEFTSGTFSVAVEFDAQGGAPIVPQTFECILDRDVLVGTQVVSAGPSGITGY